jgi:DNA-binding MarR family transcriptional regulator
VSLTTQYACNMNFENKAYYLKIDATIKKIRTFFQKQFDDAGLDITVDQWVVLDNASRSEGISQIELADLVYKDAPTVTRIIDLLVKKEMVTRRMSETDRRRFNIYLTEKGKAVFQQALPLAIEARKTGWKGMNEQDFKEFYRVLDTIYENYQ